MIDLDASCVLGENERKGSKYYAGLKFSSGVVPQEMIFEMTEGEKDKYLKYGTFDM